MRGPDGFVVVEEWRRENKGHTLGMGRKPTGMFVTSLDNPEGGDRV